MISAEYPQAYIDEAENEDECLAKIKLFSYELVLLDLNMPDSDSFNIAQYLNRCCPQTKTLVVTMNSEEVYAMRYFQEGVKGFLNKSANNSELLRAINVVLSGKTFITDNLMRIWAERQIDNTRKNPFDALSQREFQIAVELIRGRSIREIAGGLYISASTVSTYKGKIFEKLAIPSTNLSRLIELARENNVG